MDLRTLSAARAIIYGLWLRAVPVTALSHGLYGIQAKRERKMGNDRKKQNTSGRSRTLLTVLVIVVMLAVIGGLVAFILLRPEAAPEAKTYETEVAAKLGQLEHKSEAEVIEELNRVIEEGMFHIAINSRPVFQDGESAGNLEIENVPNNHYLMRVEIRLEDTGELVYSTKYIEPNMHIQTAVLDVPLEKGVYFANAVFYAYDPDSLVEMGSVGTKVTLYVLN